MRVIPIRPRSVPSTRPALISRRITRVGHQNAVCEKRQAATHGISLPGDAVQLYKIGLMVTLARAVIAYVWALFVPRHKLALEAAPLRQQLAVWKRKHPRPKLHRLDRLFWIALRQLWSGWAEALIIVKPETVVSWHRAGFRLFWRLRSRSCRPGRPKISEEIRQLIRRMKADNPTWGAPRIHGELLHLGFEISEPTVSRYLQGLKRHCDEDKAKRWLAFLSNHREVIAAFDFFTVPTITFRVLYCFFVIEHDRRRILHFNATADPP